MTMTNKTMQTLNQIDEELTAFLLKGKDKEGKLLEEVEVAKASEAEAVNAAIKAKQEDNAKAFAKANQEQRTAKDIADFYLAKLDEIKNDPYISKEDYTAYTARIMAELDQLNNESKAKAGALLKELVQIKEDFEPVLQAGQTLLRKLQYELYKDYAEATSGKGTKFHLESLENKYRDYSLIQWLEYINKTYASEQLQKHAE